MSVVDGHTCHGTGFSGSRPIVERQAECPACQSERSPKGKLSEAKRKTGKSYKDMAVKVTFPSILEHDITIGEGQQERGVIHGSADLQAVALQRQAAAMERQAQAWEDIARSIRELVAMVKEE